MIREPSAFSYVRNLCVGDSVSVPAEKGYAIRCAVAYLEAEYGYPITVYAAGDYGNDTQMLECADVAVCPSNALPEIKAICDHVFCDHDEGLIADIVRHIENNL